jgi:tetratricopeptide (TPR) repeat protein
VLHIVPVDFDSSLYHERYAMTAIAVACAILPQALHGLAAAMGGRARFAAIVGYSLMLAWLALATLNIRVTLPLWSDETRLWQWAVRNNPDSALAANHLLSAYMEKQDYARARPVARFLLNDRRACPVCLVNVANMAMGEGDIATARRSLDRAERMLPRVAQRRLDQLFTLSRGHLRELELDTVGAAADYRRAIELEPLDPAARMSLAILLARHGNAAEARAEGQRALDLYAPDERPAQEQRLRQAFVSATDTPPKP